MLIVASLEADAVRETVNATAAVAAVTARVMAIRQRLLLVMSLLSSGVYKTPASARRTTPRAHPPTDAPLLRTGLRARKPPVAATRRGRASHMSPGGVKGLRPKRATT